MLLLSNVTGFKPVEIGYSLSDFIKSYHLVYGNDHVPEFTNKDPSPYNLMAFFQQSMMGISYNGLEALGLGITGNNSDICNYIRLNYDKSITIELSKGFNLETFFNSKIVDRLKLCMSNIDCIGNILPGVWDDRYSFNVTNIKDVHWQYSLSFMLYVIKVLIESIQFEYTHVKEMTAYCDNREYFIKVVAIDIDNGRYDCTINMPNHVFNFDKKFFDAVYSKGCEMRENGKETKDQ